MGENAGTMGNLRMNIFNSEGGVARSFASVLGLLTFLVSFAGCSNGTQQPVDQVSGAILLAPSFSVTLPSGVETAQVAVDATDSLTIEDGATIQTTSGGFAAVSTAGKRETRIGPGASLGTVTSEARVEVLRRSKILGDIRSGS
ncbi:MAG TPA: hypothetical protein VNW92_14970, partial [Polyangiaceae bacterium]|nr:hypothetical protein [Polyangiaceae bacterium]